MCVCVCVCVCLSVCVYPSVFVGVFVDQMEGCNLPLGGSAYSLRVPVWQNCGKRAYYNLREREKALKWK